MIAFGIRDLAITIALIISTISDVATLMGRSIDPPLEIDVMQMTDVVLILSHELVDQPQYLSS